MVILLVFIHNALHYSPLPAYGTAFALFAFTCAIKLDHNSIQLSGDLDF